MTEYKKIIEQKHIDILLRLAQAKYSWLYQDVEFMWKCKVLENPNYMLLHLSKIDNYAYDSLYCRTSTAAVGMVLSDKTWDILKKGCDCFLKEIKNSKNSVTFSE